MRIEFPRVKEENEGRKRRDTICISIHSYCEFWLSAVTEDYVRSRRVCTFWSRRVCLGFRVVLRHVSTHHECISACRCSANKQDEYRRSTCEREKRGAHWRLWLVKTSWRGSCLFQPPTIAQIVSLSVLLLVSPCGFTLTCSLYLKLIAPI